MDFARVESTPPKDRTLLRRLAAFDASRDGCQESLTKGRAPKAKGDDDRELPKDSLE